jgi:hypothetical protein
MTPNNDTAATAAPTSRLPVGSGRVPNKSETETVIDEPTPDAPEYRDLQIEPRKPPVRVRFNPPLEFDGQKYSELTFDFDSMRGKDFIRAERTFQKLYKGEKNEIAMPELKHLYHDLILAHLADVSYLLIQNLERRYYVPLRTEALKACGSSPDEDEKA